MKILVVSATAMETAIFSTHYQNDLNKDKYSVEMLITGVGTVNTAYHLLKKVINNHFDIVIQAGIGGTFDKEIALGDVFFISEDTFGDLGMEESHHFQTIFQAGFANPDEYPFSNGWLKNDHPLIEKKMFPSVRAVTINKVTDDALQQQQLMATFDPILESMEGAAFHYVCLMEKIPFIQIRAISNYVGDRNKANWKFKESIANLNNALIEIVRKYMVNS